MEKNTDSQDRKIEDKIIKINKCFIAFSADPDNNIASLTSLCGELLNADCALYNVLSDDMFVSIGKWRTAGSFKQTSKAEGHICYDLIKLEKDRMLVINDLSKTKYYASDPGVKSNKFETYIGYKVEISNKIIGTLCVLYKANYSVINDDKLIMGIIASAIGVEELHKRSLIEKEVFLKELIQKEKMAGVGTLAAGVAHEFNNMFQVINGYLAKAQTAGTPEELQESLAVILETSQDAAQTIKNLLIFSRQDKTKIELTNIADLIELVLSILEKHLKKTNINVIKKYGNLSFLSFVNKADIQQVFLNIIMNAKDAMSPNGGDLIIDISKDEKNMQIEFFDTGKGMDEESLKRVFEPFYSTKGSLGGGDMPGSGLGLFASYGIVHNHGGSIEIKSKLGQGCKVIVSLPMADTATGKAAAMS